jgi:spermidine/putrescine transport system substrate-binding protein
MDRPDPHRTATPQIDPAWLRGATQRRFSRRDVLRYAGIGGGALAASSVLSACGVGGGKAEKTDEKSFWDGKTQAGELVFANWPLYIDKAKGKHPSLDLFTERTGIKVTYKEDIQEMPSFWGRIQPVLAAGQSTGYDLMVLTNGIYLDKALEANYLIPLDHTQLPNFNANAGPAIKNPSYDPGNKYTAAWQSGITGIAYNPEFIDGEITSIQDLYNPKYKEKVGMFADNLDLPNFALLGIGVSPEDSTPDDWQTAADKLKEQAPLVLKYYEQGYIKPLAEGDTWISMAWSGDIFQTNLERDADKQLKFLVPEEGGLIWTDNLCIPIGAEHPVDALKMIDFAYDTEIAAMIAEWVNYITPVPGAQSVIEADAAKAKGGDRSYLESVAESPLVFPTSDMVAKLHNYRVLTDAEEKQWNSIFEPIYQG